MSDIQNAVENVVGGISEGTVDQGELQGVPSAAEVQEVAKAKRRDRLSAKAKAKVKADSKPGKGKGKQTPAPAPESLGKEPKDTTKGKGKASKSKGLALKIKAGRLSNVKELFAATDNGKGYAVSRFIVRLLNAVFNHLRDGKGGKWDRKVGEGLGDGLEYHWLLKTTEEGTTALQHATDAAKVLGFKLGTGNGDGDGFLTVEPDGKQNSKQQRLVFAY